MSFASSKLRNGFIVMLVIGSSLGAVVLVGNRYPVHNYNHILYDEQGDVTLGNLDIIEYGSYEQENFVVLYLVTKEDIPQTSVVYNLFIVAKTPGIETAHIYNNEFYNGTESNYGSRVKVNGSRLEMHFSKDNFIANSYMIGIEARISGMEVDMTVSSRENPIMMKSIFF